MMIFPTKMRALLMFLSSCAATAMLKIPGNAHPGFPVIPPECPIMISYYPTVVLPRNLSPSQKLIWSSSVDCAKRIFQSLLAPFQHWEREGSVVQVGYGPQTRVFDYKELLNPLEKAIRTPAIQVEFDDVLIKQKKYRLTLPKRSKPEVLQIPDITESYHGTVWTAFSALLTLNEIDPVVQGAIFSHARDIVANLFPVLQVLPDTLIKMNRGKDPFSIGELASLRRANMVPVETAPHQPRLKPTHQVYTNLPGEAILKTSPQSPIVPGKNRNVRFTPYGRSKPIPKPSIKQHDSASRPIKKVQFAL